MMMIKQNKFLQTFKITLQIFYLVFTILTVRKTINVGESNKNKTKSKQSLKMKRKHARKIKTNTHNGSKAIIDDSPVRIFCRGELKRGLVSLLT